MEVQMSARGPKSTGRSSSPSDSHHSSGAAIVAKPVPGYLRPSAGSCHHVCKYGGTHTFEDHKEPHSRAQPRPPRKQQHPPPPAESHKHSRVLGKVRSVFRRRVVDSTSNSTTATQKPSKAGDSVEWKDIPAYDTVPVPPPHGSSTDSRHVKKKDATKGKKKKQPYSYGKAKAHEQVVDGVKDEDEALATHTADSNKSVKPPEGKSKPTALLVESMAEMLQVEGYQTLSPSLVQSRANLLSDLEKEMMVQQQEQEQEQEQEAATANVTTATSTYALDPEEYAASESSRSIPAHRRVQSMSMSSSSRPVRHAFGRQASRNSSGAVFKVRSRSTRAPPAAALVEKPPARLRSRRGSIGGGEDGSSTAANTGRGIHLRIRSLRRRGVGGGAGTGGGGGFVVPAVALRHQKTLDKKKSQRLYNNLIEETASKLVKTRKSRVKALVGAFESVISKIAK